MLSQRVKAALIFVPLVLIAIYLGGWAYNIFFAAVLFVATYEYWRLFTKIETTPSLPVMVIGVGLVILTRWFLPSYFHSFAITLLIFLVAVVALFQYERGDDHAARNFGVTLSGILYIGWIGSYLFDLRALPDGRGWMLVALPTIWLADSGAYYIGSWLGKAKLCPRLSPKKSWAGLAGSVLFGVVSGPLLILLWQSVGWLSSGVPFWAGIILGAAVALLTPVGDLLISLFKRTAGVKDTSNLIPGHGGFLDRIDTWIWAATLAYFLITIANMR
jgi:phosphatidate cytidylyltransferase